MALRRHLLRKAPRHRAVLDLAAKKAGWGGPLAQGRHRGIAMVQIHGNVCALVAEISLPHGGGVRVHQMVCVADCGQVVNPDLVEAQLEGGALDGLGAALHGEITVREGRVEQSNFHDYPLLSMSETPEVEVHLIQGVPEPQGVGETSVPVAAPAVANAVAAGGIQVNSLPIRVEAGG